MAKTTYLQIPPELEERYYSDLQSMDRFIIPRIRAKSVILSKAKKENLEQRSYLPTCSDYWKEFSDEQKQTWKDVDSHDQQHGWRTFVSDQCIRINLGLAGTATPNAYHQSMVGKILIEAPAEEIKIIQPHPSSYWISQKVTGKKSMYEPVEINEAFSLPLKIGINYKSDLTSTGEGSFARFYASIRHLYQGQNLNYNSIIEIPLSSGWDYQGITVSSMSGLAVSYSLYFHLYKVQGSLIFDNLSAKHSANNWIRDPFCDKIEQTFTRGFYQVPKHWATIILPSGAGYKSVYPE